MIRGSDKITKAQLTRVAYVYVRQSTEFQVRNNLMSQERQYELRQLAEKLGWHPESVVVLDEDLGHSADGTDARVGFTRLREEVCQGKAGLVLSLETSRLARNNREWYHLLDLCAISGTLVGDLGGVYDPSDYEDRLHLGLKGILSEAELHLLRTRLTAGIHHKAQKGELITRLPIGFVKGPAGKIVLDPDQGVRETVGLVFRRFEELGSIYALFRWMLHEGVKMPKRIGGGVLSEVAWERPRYRGLIDILSNPIYAGAYVWGRRRHFVRLEGDQPRRAVREVPMEQWKVLIQDAHSGYIPWETFLLNQQRRKQNWSGRPHGGAANRGWALCQGLARCATCGGRMYVVYRQGTRKDGMPRRESSYRCHHGQSHGVSNCPSVSAFVLDRIVEEAFLKAIEPAQIELTLEHIRRAHQETEDAERHWRLRLERADYEITRAQRQYKLVEPENRLVARTLESEWEERLRQKKTLEEEFAQWKQRQRAWSDQELAEARTLIQDVRLLWKAPTTSHQDRKELLRLLVEGVWAQKDPSGHRVHARILWRGEMQTAHTSDALVRAPKTNPEVLRWITHLAQEGRHDEDIANEMNGRGLLTLDGLPFTTRRVLSFRHHHRIATRWAEVHQACTMTDAAAKLGVCRDTIAKWAREGMLTVLRRRDGSMTWVRIAQEDVQRLQGGWDPEKEWTAKQVAEYLKIPVETVFSRFYRGQIPGRRIRVCGRWRWLIPKDYVLTAADTRSEKELRT